jgi:hypothetical protein
MATRRGFLGGVLGAAAAGPTVASIGLTPMAKYENTRASAGSSGLIGGGSYRDDLLKQITDIRKMSADDKQERYGVYRNDIHRQQIESLRSVSASHKTRMIFEADTEANYQSDIKRILRALAGLETN